MNRFWVSIEGDLTLDGEPFTEAHDKASTFCSALWDQMHVRGLEAPAVSVGDVMGLSMVVETMHERADMTEIEAILNTQVILVRTDDCSPHWDPHKWTVVKLDPEPDDD